MLVRKQTIQARGTFRRKTHRVHPPSVISEENAHAWGSGNVLDVHGGDKTPAVLQDSSSRLGNLHVPSSASISPQAIQMFFYRDWSFHALSVRTLVLKGNVSLPCRECPMSKSSGVCYSRLNLVELGAAAVRLLPLMTKETLQTNSFYEVFSNPFVSYLKEWSA